MIPPVEERQYRDCSLCVSHHYRGLVRHCKIYQSQTIYCRGSGDACIYHITSEELKELIENFERIIICLMRADDCCCLSDLKEGCSLLNHPHDPDNPGFCFCLEKEYP